MASRCITRTSEQEIVGSGLNRPPSRSHKVLFFIDALSVDDAPAGADHPDGGQVEKRAACIASLGTWRLYVLNKASFFSLNVSNPPSQPASTVRTQRAVRPPLSAALICAPVPLSCCRCCVSPPALPVGPARQIHRSLPVFSSSNAPVHWAASLFFFFLFDGDDDLHHLFFATGAPRTVTEAGDMKRQARFFRQKHRHRPRTYQRSSLVFHVVSFFFLPESVFSSLSFVGQHQLKTRQQHNYKSI